MEPMHQDRHWHLDKKVPIALIVTIVLQTSAVIWWASSLSARVDYLERHQAQTAPQGDRLTRVEVKLENVQSGVEEIKRLLREPVPRAAAPR